jgi:tetratricopeptide (TPR) repeat protein
MRIVLFRSEHEFHLFWPADLGGFATTRPAHAIEREPTVVLFGGSDAQGRRAFLHELTHQFIARAYGWVPMWMNEGLAAYFSTMRVEGGRAVLGEAVPGLYEQLGFLPPLPEIVGADRATFYGGGWSTEAGRDTRASHYAAAWALVHFFRNGPDAQRARFQAFVDAMNRGARAESAWAQTIGVEQLASLQREFHDYVGARASWDLMQARVSEPRAVAVDGLRVMSDEEVHLLWARIVPYPSIAEGQLAEARTQAPGSAEVSYARGCFALRHGRLAEAQASFRDALARAPAEPRYLYGLIAARGRAGGAAAGGGDLADAADTLARLAKTPDEHDLVAQLLAARGDPAQALRHAEQALALAPSDYLAYAARARAHFALGRMEEAVHDQERAVTFAPEEIVDRSLVETLAAYERAARKRPGPDLLPP